MSKLRVSVSPHIRSPKTTATIMLDVLIALLPVTVAGVIIFGPRSLAVIAAGVVSSVLAEYLFCLITKREQTVGDLSAAVTGLLLALNCPANIPIWQVVIGSVFAIIFVKCIFGGIGQNFANPAMTARVFMTIAFASMASYGFPTIVDTASSATPLAEIMAGKSQNLLNLFLGLRGGAIGETCILALLIGAAYLTVRRVISLKTPLAFILTVFAMSFIISGADFIEALALVMSGGLILGAFFMATDYATTPVTGLGKIIFGVGAGLITVMIRYLGSYPEGVSFAILLMNIVTPYIDRLTVRVPFGAGGAKK